MGELRVLQKIQVCPPLSSQAPQPLSFLDSVWLSGAQVEWLFFYDFPHPISHFIDNHLQTFITSLSLTLRHFYPLAGTIRRSPASEDQSEIMYTDGDFVTITIAEFTGDDFRHISGHHPRNFNKLSLLVPRPSKPSSDGKSPLLSVQVTLFANQGLCIAFVLNHAACDGSGSMQFIRSWAAACRLGEDTLDNVVPLLDRSVIVDKYGLRQKMLERARKIQQMYQEDSGKPKEAMVKSFSPSLVSGTFTLTKDQIARLKKQVQARTAEEGTPLLHLSSFVVTCAYVLRCLVNAWGYEEDHDTYFACAVDWRLRMRPPVPINYFGNCLGTCITEALKAGNIAGKDGVEVAAMAIGKIIDGLQGKEVGEVIIETIDKYLEMVKTKSIILSVAGSPKLGVYQTDFGWGRPLKVEVTSIAETGAMALAESREEGGVEIGLVLPEEEMKKFGTNFETALLDI